ncbi:MAG: ROK family protein [Ruminococcaceae bacterium]|nr:ROK family protein [Oscillospiraceae bacterium]
MYSIGIDLGGTNIAGGLVDEQHNIVQKKSVKTRAPRPVEEIAHDIAELCKDLAKMQGLDIKDVGFAGVASPGIIRGDIVETASNLGFYKAPLAKLVSDEIGIKTYLQNDANIAAYAEGILGAGVDCNSLVLVTLGTGVGGGIILNKKIYDGFNGAGAEIGHIIIENGGNACGCGNNGCFEAYCSATALINATKKAMRKDRLSQMWNLCDNDIEKVSGKTAFDGMRLNDPTAKLVVNGFIHYLAVGISNIITLLQPEMVAIGGGLSKEGDYILKPLLKEISAFSLLKNDAMTTKVTMAKFENDAGILGASLLGYKDFKVL